MCYTIEVTLLHWGPYKELKPHNNAPGLRKTPWKDSGACNATLGRGGGAAGQNPVRPTALSAGDRWERSSGSPRVGWRGWTARTQLRRGRATVVCGGGRSLLLLRRGRHNAGQRATVQASTGSREEFRTVGKHWVKAEGKFTGRRSMADDSAMVRAGGAGDT
jgi:hypothetical protein